MTLPAMSIGTGSVNGMTCDFPEKPIVFIDDVERGSLEPSFPMHEYVAPVSTMKGYSRSWMTTGMMGSSCDWSDIAGNIVSPSGSSGHPYQGRGCSVQGQFCAGPSQGLLGH